MRGGTTRHRLAILLPRSRRSVGHVRAPRGIGSPDRAEQVGTPHLARRSGSCAWCSFLGRTLVALQDQAEGDPTPVPSEAIDSALLCGVSSSGPAHSSTC